MNWPTLSLSGGGGLGTALLLLALPQQKCRGRQSLPFHRLCMFVRVFCSAVNSIQWASHEWGLMLACASSDESFSVVWTAGGWREVGGD